MKTELLRAMGFPITDAEVAAAGADCQWSDRCAHSANPARTRASTIAATGNAMHVASVGAVLLSTLLRYPRLVEISTISESDELALCCDFSAKVSELRRLKRARSS